MKYLGLILLLALAAGHALARTIDEDEYVLKAVPASNWAISEKFRKYLENDLKTLMREGNKEKGVPPVDPYVGESVALQADEGFLKGNLTLAKFEVEGLSDYRVDEAWIRKWPTKITIGATWARINSTGLYNLDVMFPGQDFHAFGKGEYTVALTDLSFYSEIWFKVLGGVRISSMATKLSLGGVSLSATGILGDEANSATHSETISKIGPQLLQDYQKHITDIIHEKVTTNVNAILYGKSISEIIAMFG